MKSLASPILLFASSTIALADVVINEIHYDPEPKTELVEFVELLNTGTEVVSLANWSFTNGFEYTFPAEASLGPGDYLILTEDVNDYNRKFGSIFVGGQKAFAAFDSGTLSNEGDRVVLRNADGAIRDEVEYKSTFPWPIAPQGEPVQSNGDGVSMELLNPSLDNNLAGSWRAGTKPSPGDENTVFTELAVVPPHIRQVDHSPNSPRGGDIVTVSAKVTDPDGVAGVTLSYQHVEPGDYIRLEDAEYETVWVDLEMRDDGATPDLVAEDGVFAVTMPGDINQHRHLVRYRIAATDALGNELQVPYADDPQPNFAYFVYDGVPAWEGAVEPGETATISFSEETMNSIAVYHLIATRSDIEAQQWGGGGPEWFGTVVYDGEVYDHMTFSKRGRASLGQVGKEKWDWNFNRGHRFQARDNYGKKYSVKWREINVLPGTNPWWGNDVSTDGTILNESVGFRIYQLMGSPASNTNFFQMRVIDDTAEVPSNQYNGDLFGLYIAIQDPDSRFIQERGLPDGNLYNWHSNGDPLKNQGQDSVDDGSDQRDFKSNLRANTSLEWWQEHLNFDAYYAFNSGNLLINNSDMRPNENMMSYYHPDGKCYPIPWDLDLTFEAAPHLGRGDTPAWENIYRVLSHDEVDLPYQNRIREYLSLLCNRHQSSMLVDEYSRFVWIDVPQSDRVAVSSLVKDGSRAIVTTASPHGFETGDVVTMEGVNEPVYNGDNEITKVSDTVFTYRASIFAPAPTGDQVAAFKTPDAKPLVLVDQAMWDYHPRKRKEGRYYKNIKGIATEDFKGYQAYMKDFIAPGGYGYELLASHADEGSAPDTPTITYVGAGDFSVSDLRFEVTEFKGGSIFSPQEFAAVQWRIAETTDRNDPSFDPTVPRVYEINADWQSEEIAPFENTLKIDEGLPRADRTYRVRARMKNTAGHWSLWSDPVQFKATAPDITTYTDGLFVTEVMYHPRVATPEEKALGYSATDFEFVELLNLGEELDLTQVRFTKGVDFDFAGSAVTTLGTGEYVLVVENIEAFALRYPGAGPVAGEYSGQLSNGGERLKLSYGAGTPIRDFDYNDGGDWPVEADGDGYSLTTEQLNPDADFNVAGSWTISREVGGSPGASEADIMGTVYTVWNVSHFSEAELADENVSGPNADPDGDGDLNWVEYALQQDPRAPDSRAPGIANVDGKTIFSHGFAVADDVTYQIEQSSDLIAWEVVNGSAQVVNGSIRESTIANADSATYLRLRLTWVPQP